MLYGNSRRKVASETVLALTTKSHGRRAGRRSDDDAAGGEDNLVTQISPRKANLSPDSRGGATLPRRLGRG